MARSAGATRAKTAHGRRRPPERKAAREALDRAVPARSIRRMATVAADAEAEDVLSRMRQTGAHLATVEDSSGAVLGVLFLEDIVEELIGEVHDASGRA